MSKNNLAWFHAGMLLTLFVAAGEWGLSRPGGDWETGFPPASRDYGKSVWVGDPVTASAGSYFWELPLLNSGGAFDLGFRLLYRSEWFRFNQGLRYPFWWYPFCAAESEVPFGDDRYASVYLPDGGMVSFVKDAQGLYRLAGPDVDIGYFVYEDNFPRFKHQLVEAGEYLYFLDAVLERVYVFETWRVSQYDGHAYWRPLCWLDRNGHVLNFSYNQATDFLPAAVNDGLGHALTFTYQGSTLQSVIDQCGRTITINFEAAGADNNGLPTVRSVTNAQGDPITFSYAGQISFKADLIAGVTYPEGNTPFQQTYGLAPLYNLTAIRMLSQTDAYGNQTDFGYNPEANTFTAAFPDGTTQIYKHHSSHGFPESITDEAGQATTFTKSETESLTGVTGKDGAVTTFGAHPESGRPALVTDALGGTTAFTYAAVEQTFANPVNGDQVVFTFYDLVRVDYPDGAWESFAYDGRGNLTVWTDRGGAAWTYQVGAHGETLALTTPGGGVFSYGYDGSERLVSRQDGGTGVTTYEYDACHRLVRLTHPDGTFVAIAYSPLDLITSITDENGHTHEYGYDRNGRLLSVTDAAGGTTQYGYDLMDRVVAVSNRTGHTHSFTYDVRGRLAQSTDPSGVAATLGYEARGWLDRLTVGGQTWQTGYNDEGITTRRTTPLGRPTRLQSDALGRLRGVLDPLDQALSIGRDALGRYTEVTDPLSATTRYAYDGRGLLTGVTLPDGTAADYLYTSQGLLDSITDLDGASWEFGYTPEGRLAESRDPLGRSSTFAYDSRGRLGGVTRPGGEQVQLTRDGTGNITGVATPGKALVEFSYDANDRLTGTLHLALERDAEGRVTSTRDGTMAFGAAYDPAGRLAAVSYANDALTVNYTYDAQTGLLRTVSDSLTGTAVEFQYDGDFRLTLINLPGGEEIRYTWDAASRLTRLRSGRRVDFEYTRDAAGRVTGVAAVTPLTVEEELEPEEETRSFDAAGQASGAGWVHDGLGRVTAAPGHVFVWDAAAGLTGLDGDTLEYNGLGGLRRRLRGEQVAHYYHNHALARQPLVAEADGQTGQIQRYYVWTPDGRLLYLIDAAAGNAVRFYHFDVTGHTLALTDVDGACTDAYAYDPYGRLLARAGDSEQPFTYAGKWGVRRLDEAGTLYLMGARPYDAVSGRFLSREPLWPQLADARQLNPYLYAKANPVSWVDSSGLEPNLVLNGLADWWGEQITRQIETGMYTEQHRQFASTVSPLGPNHTYSFQKGWSLFADPGKCKSCCKECVDSVESNLAGDRSTKDPTANGSQTANADGTTVSDVLHTVNVIAQQGSTASGLISGTVSHSGVVNYAVNKAKLPQAVWKATPLKNLSVCNKINVWQGAKVAGKSCTIVAGVISWYEVGEHFTKTPAEISKEVGENSQSWNPLVRVPHEIGSWIGDWLYGD